MIYFDNAATTYPKPESVYKKLDEAQRNLAFNAGRGHYKEANAALDTIEETRKYLCEMINAKNLIFTSSATAAINQIIQGIPFEEGDIVYCSPYDHNAIARTLYAYSNKYKFHVKLIPLKEDMTIDLEKFEFEYKRHKPKAVFCTHVSNVLGYILPIEEIGNILSSDETLYIIDGAQAFGLVNCKMNEINADYYVFAGHKTLYGPFGIAGYFTNREDLGISFYGGTGTDSLNLDMPSYMSLKYEPSSMNVVGIAGLLEGAKWVSNINALEHEKKLVEYFKEKAKEIDGLIIYCDELVNIAGIISLNVEGYLSDDLANVLADDYNICVRGGYHCCPYIHELIGSKEFLGTVRVSFSCFSTIEEVDELIEALEDISYGV